MASRRAAASPRRVKWKCGGTNVGISNYQFHLPALVLGGGVNIGSRTFPESDFHLLVLGLRLGCMFSKLEIS